MQLPHHNPLYVKWAPVIARIIFALTFLMSAFYKIPGTESFAMQVEMSGSVGIPLPFVAVTLAFILEVIAGIALLIGWHTRTAAILLAGFVFLVALFFYRDWSNQATFGLFISCLLEIAGLLYISVYGAESVAIKRDTQTLSHTATDSV